MKRSRAEEIINNWLDTSTEITGKTIIDVVQELGMSEVSDNKIIFKAPTAGVYKFDNGKVNLIVKAADGCPECFNLAQELLKEKEAYEKLKAQLEKAEKIISYYASEDTWIKKEFDKEGNLYQWWDKTPNDKSIFPYSVGKSNGNFNCLGGRAREYFKEINKGESK